MNIQFHIELAAARDVLDQLYYDLEHAESKHEKTLIEGQIKGEKNLIASLERILEHERQVEEIKVEGMEKEYKQKHAS